MVFGGGRAHRDGGQGGLLGHVVEHTDLIQDRLELGDKALVGWVGEVGFQSGFVGEGDEETVGEAVVKVLRAHIGAPLEGLYGINLFGQFDEGFFDGLHLLRRGGVLEFEENDVAVGSFSGGGGHEENGSGEGEEQEFHGSKKRNIPLS